MYSAILCLKMITVSVRVRRQVVQQTSKLESDTPAVPRQVGCTEPDTKINIKVQIPIKYSNYTVLK